LPAVLSRRIVWSILIDFVPLAWIVVRPRLLNIKLGEIAMTCFNIRNFILLSALSVVVEVAYGQSCVTSDGYENTACGTNSLKVVEGANGGAANSAFGYNALYHNTTGANNTALGLDALQANTTGYDNTASGLNALQGNTTGYDNTALGLGALTANSTGNNNTASGMNALEFNETGNNNTAIGFEALINNTIGYDNTASGSVALFSNTTGEANTASGYQALSANTTGSDNTALGVSALVGNQSGGNNTATGGGALFSNKIGNYNTASGFYALYSNTTGNDNIALGYEAGGTVSTGSNNIALGTFAGINVTTGSENIDIGNEGVATDNGHIRIGTAGSQKEVFIAGIENSKITGSAVYVNSNGRLGVLASSERYKTAIAPMGSNTAKLEQLRPVTFKLKTDAKGAIQYGLIAEEVAKVFPELVIRDEKGRIDGVRYDELAPMLLNEMQQQQRINSAQAAEIRELKGQAAELNNLKEEMRAALQELKSKDQLVAQR
jgi:trimeric autotransporter adhesin